MSEFLQSACRKISNALANCDGVELDPEEARSMVDALDELTAQRNALLGVSQKIAANAQSFISVWEFDQFSGVDGEELFAELKAAITLCQPPTPEPPDA